MDCRKAYVTSAQKLDFLADKFTAVPDLVEDDVIKEAPAKKQRHVHEFPFYISLCTVKATLSCNTAVVYRGTGEQAKTSDKSLSSPPSSGGRSSRGRGRTRGRGSVRISAQDDRAGQSKSEPDAAELDAAMPDVPLQHIKQECLDTHQQPAMLVKAEESSAQEQLLQAADVQPHSHQAASPSIARAQYEQPAQSNLAHGHTPEQQQVSAPALAEAQMHSKAEDLLPSAEPASQALTHRSLASAGALSLPRTSLDVLPEEDDYDADE